MGKAKGMTLVGAVKYLRRHRAEACATLPQLSDALSRAMAHRGPRLIACLIPGS